MLPIINYFKMINKIKNNASYRELFLYIGNITNIQNIYIRSYKLLKIKNNALYTILH